MTARLVVEPLTAEAFAPYGSVIDAGGECRRLTINEGWTTRFDALASLDLDPEGVPLVSIFRSTPKPLPIIIELMERHPLGCQSFYPLSGHPYLLVVADGKVPDPERLRAFRAEAHQGINYRRGTWHHYSLALDGVSDFLVVDRGGPGDNLEEVRLAEPQELVW